jgi:hypothetical protein
MTSLSSDGTDAKPTLFARTAPWLLAISSALIGILLVEVFCWVFVPNLGRNMPNNRVVFFGGEGPIFENHGDIFTYTPHNTVRNVTAFFSSDDFAVEYDYRFRTNNLGLVQDADVAPVRKSLLLLGDSFTEGQGAEPWFRVVSPTIERLGYQPVNGGVLGTGFQQWLELGGYLSSKNIDVSKVIVLFISDDYQRPVWNVPSPVFKCISSASLCRVEQSYFYRLPPPGEMRSWIVRVRDARGPMKPHLQLSASALLPASSTVYTYLKQLVTHAQAKSGSRAAISELVDRYGRENVAFLHLPQKDEIAGGPNDLGLAARRAIEAAGGTLFDGFKLCQMTPSDYFLNDDHPNAHGYSKIATCTAEVASSLVSERAQGERGDIQ